MESSTTSPLLSSQPLSSSSSSQHVHYGSVQVAPHRGDASPDCPHQQQNQQQDGKQQQQQQQQLMISWSEKQHQHCQQKRQRHLPSQAQREQLQQQKRQQQQQQQRQQQQQQPPQGRQPQQKPGQQQQQQQQQRQQQHMGNNRQGVNAVRYPPLWESMDNQEIEVFELALESEEGRQVSQHFNPPENRCVRLMHRVCKPCIARMTLTRIFRIQNPALWSRYDRCRQTMEEERGGEKVREMLLFHGTLAQNVDSIGYYGFDLSMVGTNGCSLGRGVYFTDDIIVAHTFSLCSPDYCPQAVQYALPLHHFRRRRPAHSGERQPSVDQPPAAGDSDCLPVMAGDDSDRLPLLADDDSNHQPLLADHQTSSADHQTSSADHQTSSADHQPSSADSTVVIVDPEIGKRPKRPHYMLLSNVLVGQTAPGYEMFTQPPLVDPINPRGPRYDSCHNVNMNLQGEYVIFRKNQMYPQYLLEYKHSGCCRILYSIACFGVAILAATALILGCIYRS